MEKKKMGIGFGSLILRDSKVLLGRRHEDPSKADSVMHGEGTWTMPGGKLEFGESFEKGAQREIMEETGADISQEDIEVISLTNDIVSDAHFVTVGVICRNYPGEPKVMEPDEIVEWKWFSLENLPSPIFPPSKKILENYSENIFYKKGR